MSGNLCPVYPIIAVEEIEKQQFSFLCCSAIIKENGKGRWICRKLLTNTETAPFRAAVM